MAIFMLDCDSVTATASSINTLVSQFSQLADSVNGYDTSCEEGFDFAGGKAAISANIEACTTKVQNTVKLVEGVVTSHTTLQNSFSLDQNGSVEDGSQNRVDNSDGSNSGYSTGSGGNYNSSGDGNNNLGGYSSGGGYSSSGGNSFAGGTSTGGVLAGVASGAADNISNALEQATAQNPVDVTNKINAVDQVTVDVDKLDPENKTQFITGMTYNENGYAIFEDKYVIVCDTTLAKVGDNLVFTKPDGTKIDCVVGAVVDYSQEYKGNVSFIVSDTWNAQGANNLTFDLNNMKILNNGQYVPKKG